MSSLVFPEQLIQDGDGLWQRASQFNETGGLTKRELFAAMAMQTFMQGAVLPPGFDVSEQLAHVANRACEVADALLAELERTS